MVLTTVDRVIPVDNRVDSERISRQKGFPLCRKFQGLVGSYQSVLPLTEPYFCVDKTELNLVESSKVEISNDTIIDFG